MSCLKNVFVEIMREVKGQRNIITWKAS